MAEEALAKATKSPMPALIVDGDKKAIDYFTTANKAEPTKQKNLLVCPYHPLQKVMLSDSKTLTKELGDIMWEEFFKVIRRINTSPLGDTDRRIVPEECGFVWHVEDTRLGDNGGISHDWLEHVPKCVSKNPSKKVPIIIISHGMSDNPLKAADMFKMHEIGEREGFITVYTFSSDRYKWNLNMSEDLLSDMDFYVKLIEYLKKAYPVDETRVYLSGFSNGAGMAMTFALLHPELIAAICPVDSTFPYAGEAIFGGAPKPMFLTEILKPGEEPKRPIPPKEDPVKNMAPLSAALERQKKKAYQMPVMYFYGTREREYPIRPGSNQHMQYDFWKSFNGIAVKESVADLKPDAVGVSGDEVWEHFPSAEHPEHRYTHHMYYTKEGKDYYHFLLMHGKAHDVHPSEAELGWGFVSRFSRNAEGSLNDSGVREDE
jgi:poly(3-hydroxybutyrate) depolymerase